MDAPVARESCRSSTELQLHSVQGGPVPCRTRIKLLTHDKTREENETSHYKEFEVNVLRTPLTVVKWSQLLLS